MLQEEKAGTGGPRQFWIFSFNRYHQETATVTSNTFELIWSIHCLLNGI